MENSEYVFHPTIAGWEQKEYEFQKAVFELVEEKGGKIRSAWEGSKIDSVVAVMCNLRPGKAAGRVAVYILDVAGILGLNVDETSGDIYAEINYTAIKIVMLQMLKERDYPCSIPNKPIAPREVLYEQLAQSGLKTETKRKGFLQRITDILKNL